MHCLIVTTRRCIACRRVAKCWCLPDYCRLCCRRVCLRFTAPCTHQVASCSMSITPPCRGAAAVTFLVWCIFSTHGKLGNLLTFVGGALFAVLLLGAVLVRQFPELKTANSEHLTLRTIACNAHTVITMPCDACEHSKCICAPWRGLNIIILMHCHCRVTGYHCAICQ